MFKFIQNFVVEVVNLSLVVYFVALSWQMRECWVTRIHIRLVIPVSR